VAERRERLLAPTRSNRRVANHARLALGARAACEDESELILRVRSHVTRGLYAPRGAVNCNRTKGHLELHLMVNAQRARPGPGRRRNSLGENHRIVGLRKFHERVAQAWIFEDP